MISHRLSPRSLQRTALLLLSLTFLALGSVPAQAQIGKAWRERAIGGATNSRGALAFSGSVYVAGSSASAGAVETSTDGDTWTVVATGLSSEVRHIIWNGTQFLAVADNELATSTNPNGSAWTVTQPFISGSLINGMARSGSNIVAVGFEYTLHSIAYLSTDSGASWTEQTLPASVVDSLEEVTYTGSLWVAVGGDQGTICTSPDGMTWTKRSIAAPAGKYFRTVASNGTMTVAAGYAFSGFMAKPIIYTSTNGSTWTARTVAGEFSLNSAVWTGSNFVIVGDVNSAATSPDGITWTSQDTGSTDSLSAAVWDGTQVLAVGFSGAVYSSDLLPFVTLGAETSAVIEGAGSFRVNAFLSTPATVPLSIPITVTGSASISSDFSGVPATVAFAIGESTKTFTMTLTNDAVAESDEDIILTLGKVPGVNLGTPKEQTITIIDDDSPPSVSFSSEVAHVTEHVGVVTVAVDLSWSQTTPVTVPITATGAATGADYSGVPASLTFTPGETHKTISITVTDDTVEENDEDLVLEFGALTGAVAGTSGTYTLTIDDNDPDSAAGRRWRLRQPTPSSPYMQGITMAGTRAVVVNSGGEVLTSDDAGMTWTERNSGSTRYLGDVAFGNAMLVAVGEYGTVITSTDNGVSWTTREIPGASDVRLYAVTRGATEFVALGAEYVGDSDRPRVYASANGIDWVLRPVPSASIGTPYSVVSMGGSKFAAVGTNYSYDYTTDVQTITSLILTTEDGVNWTDHSSAIPSAELGSVIWTGTTLVAFSYSGTDKHAYTSTDGATWAPRTLGALGSCATGVWNGSKVLAVGTAIATSTNGITWTQKASGTTTSLYGVVWTGSSYIARGDHSIFTSPDGVAWTRRGVGPDTFSQMRGAVWSGTQFVAVGGEPAMAFTSPDGSTWTQRTLPSVKGQLNSVAWSGTTFAAVGTEGVILTSTNGSTWTKRAQPGGTLNLKKVIWAGNQFVAVGGHSQYEYPAVGPAGSIILTSPNGTTWTRRTIPTIIPLEGVAWNGRFFVAVGRSFDSNNAVILVSEDAVHWSDRDSNLGGRDLRSIAWSGSEWVAVASARVVVRSADVDAATWTSASTVPTPSGTRYDEGLNEVIWTGTEFMCATAVGTTLHSSDGDIWTERLTATSLTLNGLAMSTNTLVALGDEGTILSSGSSAPPTLYVDFDASSSSVSESDGVANILVRISGPPSVKITVPITATPHSGMVLIGATADVTLPAPLQVVFNPGETAKFISILIKNDKLDEGLAVEDVVLQLGTPTGSPVVLAGTTAPNHTLYVTDDDTVPVINTNPSDQLVVVGDHLALTMNVGMGSLPISYQWKKNGSSIKGATKPTYYVDKAKLTDGGDYTCTATNAAGSDTTSARVGVYEKLRRAVYIDIAKDALGSTITQAASSNCILSWYKDASLTELAPSASFIYNASKSSLKILNPSANSGVYVCKVQLFAAGLVATPEGATWDVGAASAKPTLDTITLPAGSVGKSYTAALAPAPASAAVATWKATGLPTGLTLDTNSGIISGYPTIAGTKTVTITATNGKGTSAPRTATLAVSVMPPGLIGTSIGLMDREPSINRNLGARIQFSFTSTGSFTGSYTAGTTLQSFLGQTTVLTATTASATATVLIGITTATITLNYDATLPSFTGSGTITLITPGIAGSVSTNFHTWSKHASPASYEGRHNFAIAIPSGSVGDLAIPQGTGFGTADVKPTGVVTFTGKLGNGTPLVSTCVINTDGSTIAYTSLYSGTGSFMSIPKLTLAGSSPTFASTTIIDITDASWLKLPNFTVASRDYPGGWPVIALDIHGGEYNVPAPTAVVMGMSYTAGLNNADISFIEAGRPGSPINSGVGIRADGTISTFFTLPHSIKLKVTRTTGAFSGTLDFTDTVNDIAIKRNPIAYEGLIIPGLMSGNALPDQGIGFFKLPHLPDATISPMPAITSTPILTGKVELTPQ